MRTCSLQTRGLVRARPFRARETAPLANGRAEEFPVPRLAVHFAYPIAATADTARNAYRSNDLALVAPRPGWIRGETRMTMSFVPSSEVGSYLQRKAASTLPRVVPSRKNRDAGRRRRRRSYASIPQGQAIIFPRHHWLSACLHAGNVTGGLMPTQEGRANL